MHLANFNLQDGYYPFGFQNRYFYVVKIYRNLQQFQKPFRKSVIF